MTDIQQRLQAGGQREEDRGTRAAPDPYAFLPDDQLQAMASRGDPRAIMEVSLRHTNAVGSETRMPSQHIQQNGPTPSYAQPPMILDPGAQRARPGLFEDPMTWTLMGL